MCQFETLYSDGDNYIVYCLTCCSYQILFGNTLLSLQEGDFTILYELTRMKYEEENYFCNVHPRNINIPTPAPGMYMLLTRREACKFLQMLEEADNEKKAKDLIKLFNH